MQLNCTQSIIRYLPDARRAWYGRSLLAHLLARRVSRSFHVARQGDPSSRWQGRRSCPYQRLGDSDRHHRLPIGYPERRPAGAPQHLRSSDSAHDDERTVQSSDAQPSITLTPRTIRISEETRRGVRHSCFGDTAGPVAQEQRPRPQDNVAVTKTVNWVNAPTGRGRAEVRSGHGSPRRAQAREVANGHRLRPRAVAHSA